MSLLHEISKAEKFTLNYSNLWRYTTTLFTSSPDRENVTFLSVAFYSHIKIKGVFFQGFQNNSVNISTYNTNGGRYGRSSGSSCRSHSWPFCVDFKCSSCALLLVILFPDQKHACKVLGDETVPKCECECVLFFLLVLCEYPWDGDRQ